MESEITINGEKYYSEEKYNKDLNEIKEVLNSLEKSTEKKKAKRFNDKDYIKLIKSMSKMFPIQSESVDEEWALKNEMNVIDPANVCMVIPKTEEAKRLLVIFKDFENDRPSPDLDLTPDYTFYPEKAPEEQIVINPQMAKFSQEYVRNILEILNVTDDAVTFTIKKDYPAIIENTHFKFIIAPRIQNEE
jgi:hypothetical protein